MSGDYHNDPEANYMNECLSKENLDTKSNNKKLAEEYINKIIPSTNGTFGEWGAYITSTRSVAIKAFIAGRESK